MLRTAAKKVAWVGRTASMVFGLALVLALMFGVATTALAGTGIGATFNLGQKNTVDRLSQLVGSTAGAMFKVDNNGTGTAVDLRVGSPTDDPATKTVAPMKVDSQQVVTHLNADELDGKDSAAFLTSAIYGLGQQHTGVFDGEGGARVGRQSCDPGDTLITGGFSQVDAGTLLTGSTPGSNPANGAPAWEVKWVNDSTQDTIFIEVFCADVTPPHR